MCKQRYLWTKAEDFAPECLEDVLFEENALVLKEDCYTGIFETPEIAVEAWEALVPGWNAFTPVGTSVQVQMRVKAGETWSAWLDCAWWSSVCAKPLKCTENDTASVQSGVVVMKQSFAQAFQVRVILHANGGGESPRLRLLSVSGIGAYNREEEDEPLYRRNVHAPGYAARRRDPALSRQMSLAAALVCLMNRRGDDVLPEEAAYGCMEGDGVSVPFAAAFAGCYGYTAYPVFCTLAELKTEIKNGFACAALLKQEERFRWVSVRGMDTDADGVQTVEMMDSDAYDDADTSRVWTLEEFCKHYAGLAIFVQDKVDRAALPERLPGELRFDEEHGDYTLYLRGEPCRISEEEPYTLCCTVPDGNAYATTAHKQFLFFRADQHGGVDLPAELPDGARTTVYLIRRGAAVVCCVTLPQV